MARGKRRLCCLPISLSTGETRWDFALHSPPWAGVLSTAGGLVFSGSAEGNLFALDAASGKPMQTIQLPGEVLSLLFDATSRYLFTGNGNGTIYVLRLAPAR